MSASCMVGISFSLAVVHSACGKDVDKQRDGRMLIMTVERY